MSDISEFTTKDMSDMLYDDLSVIEDTEGTATEVTLIQPTTDSVFPCRVLSTPLESTNLTQNAVPILKTFQVTIEHWADKQRFCMEMADNTDKALRERNFVRTSSTATLYDEITKKYRFIVNYEVRFNGIANSFKFIR